MPVGDLEITEYSGHVVQGGIKIFKAAGSAQRRSLIKEIVDTQGQGQPVID